MDAKVGKISASEPSRQERIAAILLPVKRGGFGALPRPLLAGEGHLIYLMKEIQWWVKR